MGAILISAAVYRRRRRQLAKHIGNGALILKSAPPTANRYSPNKYLYYLCGFAEPHCALLLNINNGRIIGEQLLCRPRDAKAEQWEGERLGPLRVRQQLQIDGGNIKDFARHLNNLLATHECVYYLPGDDVAFDAELCAIAAARRLQNRQNIPPLRAFCDVAVYLDDMRMIKDKTEIALLRRAAQISSIGHKTAMRAAAKTEYQLESTLTAAFRANNAHHAFLPIVAAGANACTLHYTANAAKIADNHLILIDAGAEYAHYAGDISRVFPANGKFSAAQAAVYDVVLRAQQKALAAIRPGVFWSAVENIAARAICKGLTQLGICAGAPKEVFATKQYRRFYMHRLGHFVGLDVHDTGRMTTADGNARRLCAGMIMTVEPGLYIPSAADIPRQYRNIGVRIEDTVLLCADGCEILTDAPKTRAEIEQWMRG